MNRSRQQPLFEILSSVTGEGAVSWSQVRSGLKAIIQKAKGGDVQAQYDLGLYWSSCGREKEAESEKWFRLAAERGHTDAQFALGQLLGRPRRGGSDESRRWYELAAEQGNLDAIAALITDNLYWGSGNIVGDEEEQKAFHDSCMAEVFKWYSKATELGQGWGLTGLGDCYANGDGIEKNLKLAISCYRRAARLGDHIAEHRLGDLFFQLRKYAEAFRWYKLAVEHGVREATYNLACCYLHGRGVEKNYSMALQLYRNAATQGGTWEKLRVACFYYADKNYCEAVKWFRMGAEAGDCSSQLALAYCYLSGRGVVKDLQNAYGWFLLSARNGSLSANKFLADIKEKLPPSAELSAKAWVEAWKPIRKSNGSGCVSRYGSS